MQHLSERGRQRMRAPWIGLSLGFALLSAAACGSTVEGPGTGGGGTGGDGGNGEGGGTACGSEVCTGIEICYQACPSEPGPSCGMPSITCGEFDFGACGCDGQAYLRLCDLNTARVKEGGPGSCTPPAGYFECEGLICSIADHVCGLDTTPFCYGRNGCNDCSCISVDNYCGDPNGTCMERPDGSIVVTCAP